MGDLSPDTEVYNLFDGIISFTESHIRDPWLEQIFHFPTHRENPTLFDQSYTIVGEAFQGLPEAQYSNNNRFALKTTVYPEKISV